MKLKTLRIMGLLVVLFCTYNLGTINAETRHMERIVECTEAPDTIDMNAFYGHGATTELFNHAHAHNASIYLKCIYKDLYR